MSDLATEMKDAVLNAQTLDTNSNCTFEACLDPDIEESATNEDLDHSSDEDIPPQQLYWQTKTELLSIYEADLKLKLEIKEMRRRFLQILQDFKEIDNCKETSALELEDNCVSEYNNINKDIESLSKDIMVKQEKDGLTGSDIINMEDINNKQTVCESELMMNPCVENESVLDGDPNDSSLLSELHPGDSLIEQEFINKYFAQQEIQQKACENGSQKPQVVSAGSLRGISTGSSYGDLTAPNQTAASESTSNWDNVYINNLSKHEMQQVQYDTKGAKPKRLKVYIQNIPWDTSSDSSYNLPCPNTKPQLHPELQKALVASRNMKSTSSMESSLANISDITKYSEMSSRWVHSQNEPNDYTSASIDDLPHQSTPTKEIDRDDVILTRRVSPTGGHVKECQGQFATPVNRVVGSDICSSLDDSTPVAAPRTRRHLFPGEDSGITGSASDYTSSPSTMRENSNYKTAIKMDREHFLTMDDNRSFNYKPSFSDTSQESNSRQKYLSGQGDVSLEVTRDSEANLDDITSCSPPDGSGRMSCDRTSSSSNISPMTSGISSSYKESDGKPSPLGQSIDLLLRTTIDGEEAYSQMVANLKAMQSNENTPTNKSSTRPPCIGKEATPENIISGKRNIADNDPLPPPKLNLSKEFVMNNNDFNEPGRNSVPDVIPVQYVNMPVPPLPGYGEMRKKAIAPPERPQFTSYDGGESVVKPVDVNELEEKSKETINVDQYAKNSSPCKDGKKKTFFKKLKGFRKHFRANSRSKNYVKND